MFKFDGSHRRTRRLPVRSHTVESLWEVVHISDVKGMISPYDRALTLARNIAQMQAVDIYKLLDDGSEPELLESYRKITD